jgi:gamma-glutamyltranspeptidase/glutathione hydrolase
MFAIAAGSRSAAEAGAEILRAGGTAGDAAVAAALVACVAEPARAGLAGGGALMARGLSRAPRLLDGFVQTPRRAVPARDLALREVGVAGEDGPATALVGAGAVATPGLGAMLAEAHARLGRMPLAEVAAPAVEAARRGVALEPAQAAALKDAEAVFQSTAEARALFCGGGDTAPAAGWRLVNPALADVIETFAAEGPRFLSEGEPAAALAALCAAGGAVTREDLRRWRPVWREPLERARGGARGGWRLMLNPSPALGGALAALALEGFGDAPGPGEVARTLAALARLRAGAKPAGLDAALAAEAAEALAAGPACMGPGSAVCVVDGAGLGVALAMANGAGCGAVLPDCGIMPNNLLGALRGGEPARWAPDARLAAALAPTLADRSDGGALLLAGAGAADAAALAQALAVALDRGARLEDALGAPRLRAAAEGREIRLLAEAAFGEEALARLRRDWPEAALAAAGAPGFGAAVGVGRDARGGVQAAADPRAGGWAATG